MADFILKYWIQLLLGALFSYILASVHRLKTRVKKLSKHYYANSCGTQALLEDRISQRHSYHTEREYIYPHDLKIVENMYKQYKALSGNGTVEILMKEMRELRIKHTKN